MFLFSNLISHKKWKKILEKHLDVKHSKTLKFFEEEINSTMKGNVEK